MAVTPVEVKKTPAPRAAADPWQSFRGEFDRPFDRFTGFGMPSMRRMFAITLPKSAEAQKRQKKIDVKAA